MTSRPEPEPPVVRPRRHVKPPAYLADFEVQRPGSERRSQQPACSSDDEAKAEDPPLSSEHESRVSTPISQRSPTSELVLLDEWRDTRGDLQRENDELRSCIRQLPEILSALQGLKAENAVMKREIQQLATTVATPCKSVPPVPAPQFHEPETCRSQPVPTTQSRDFHQYPSAQIRQITEQVRDCTISSRPDGQPEATPRYHTPAQRVSTPSHAQPHPYAEPIHSDEKLSRENYYPYWGVKVSHSTQRSEDHLQLEEALLVADSYCNSTHPYTDTMQALIKMYGQPHKLVLQNIAEVMDGPNIRTGDVKAFKLFALRVRSLVSMLEQLGSEGTVELDCGSHVSRLQSKLPHELRTSFKRYIHPLRVTIPTLLDFSLAGVRAPSTR
ncbi:hypothetical protein ROHU_028875 [Labeo rohita]|uniref:Uncharacterized protein n=1 Tax=Labeo rohita TaxID=84645 RepID=A0A498M0I2_LABRO|nr:hypothetical protein ROHU_028875 [Labeo rohita]